MAGNGKDTVLAVLQLSGGNDALQTIVPYTNGLYYDNRPHVGIPQDQVLPINDELGFNPTLAPIKELFDQGKVAVLLGVGYPNPSRSHFRSMDIWHTAAPEKMGFTGWLGRAINDMDPKHENVLKGVNFGRGLPRALALSGVPVASVGNLETYGVLTSVSGEDQRTQALEVFERMYSPAVGKGIVMEYLSAMGTDALKGADILKTAPEKYSSSVEYASDQVSQYMRDMVQVHTAGFGTRVLYTTAPFNSFDTHANMLPAHATLWQQTSRAIVDFFDDLKEHDANENVILLVFTEFGRRVRDNGTGTDHGAAGLAFVIGDRVKGGVYGEYPSLAPEALDDGDLHYNHDFRGSYGTITEKWLGLDPTGICHGNFEQFDFIK